MQPSNGKFPTDPVRTEGSQTTAEGSGVAFARPDPEVLERATRRHFTARYKLRVLQETDGLLAGELGAYLRREGLYSSHLTQWRKQRSTGALAGLEARVRESKTTPAELSLAKRNVQLEREKADLVERLRQAILILDVQKKVLSLCAQIEGSGMQLNRP